MMRDDVFGRFCSRLIFLALEAGSPSDIAKAHKCISELVQRRKRRG